jgi:hypothetical protein
MRYNNFINCSSKKNLFVETTVTEASNNAEYFRNCREEGVQLHSVLVNQ